MKNIFTAILILTTLNSFGQAFPETGDEFYGPFQSWEVLEADSTQDGSEILQDAINNRLGKTTTVLYLKGTWRFTKTVKGKAIADSRIIGEDPAKTRFIWDGEQGGTFLDLDGFLYSGISRITFDGKRKAGCAIDQSLSDYSNGFDTGNEYADLVFRNMEFGIKGGMKGLGFAEIAIVRNRFYNISKCAVSLGSFNSLDVWVWHSYFENCNIGVGNVYGNYGGGLGAGNFKVYGSVFKFSKVADIKTQHTTQCEFAFRDNYSYKSHQFLVMGFTPWSGQTTLQSNRIIDPVFHTAIEVQNQGPLTLVDNIVRSDNWNDPSPVVYTANFTDIASINNTFTVQNFIYSVYEKKIQYDRRRTSYSAIDATEPVLPGTPRSFNRTVFDLPVNATNEDIQQAINKASALKQRAIVHLPFKFDASYEIGSTLTFPAGSDVQLVGDGGGDNRPSQLIWTGSGNGPVIKINGPSKVSVRDITVNGNGKVDNILLENVDQVGSRVFMHEVENHNNDQNLIVNGLNNTRVLAYNSRWTASRKTAVAVIGGNNIKEGKTVLFGGLMWSNELSAEISNGGNLLIRDVWYESQDSRAYAKISGKGHFTLEGSRVANVHSSGVHAIQMKDFEGKATIVGNGLADKIHITGNASRAKVMLLGNLSQGDTAIINETTGDVRCFLQRAFDKNNATSFRGSYAKPDMGAPDSAFMAEMLRDVRDVHAEVLNRTADGVSDVRFYRVWTMNGKKGVELAAMNNPTRPNFTSSNSECNRSSVTLNWNITAADKVKNFVIEKSEDGNMWNVAGSTSDTTNNFEDASPASFYRIVAEDLEGQKTSSPLISASCNTYTSFSIYPNPVTDVAVLSFNKRISDLTHLQVYDSKGALVKKIETSKLESVKQIRVSLKDLPSGIYIFKAQIKDKWSIQKVIK